MGNRELMDAIAAPFSATRNAPWAPVVAFLEGLAPGERVLDLAGGNGRHAVHAAREGLKPVLFDVSRELVRMGRREARTAGYALPAVEGDAARLPFQGGSFDAGLFIAGVHCIRGRADRVRALGELHRVLRRGACALVSVWSAEQDRFRGIIAAQRSDAEAGRLKEGHEVGDVLVPWAKDVDPPVVRFFHVYTEPEFRKELEDAGLMVVKIDAVTLTRSSRPDNLFAIVRAQ